MLHLPNKRAVFHLLSEMWNFFAWTSLLTVSAEQSPLLLDSAKTNLSPFYNLFVTWTSILTALLLSFTDMDGMVKIWVAQHTYSQLRVNKIICCLLFPFPCKIKYCPFYSLFSLVFLNFSWQFCFLKCSPGVVLSNVTKYKWLMEKICVLDKLCSGMS